MPQQTNRIPFGFLDIVGAETGGKNPPFYSDELSPSVDVTELYLQHTLAGIRTTGSQAIVGDQINFLVPEAETWILRACSFRTAAVAAMTEVWEFSFTRLPRSDITVGAFPIFWTSTRSRTAPPLLGEFLEDSFFFPAPVALPSGTNLNATVIERDALAARTTLIQYLVDVLR